MVKKTLKEYLKSEFIDEKREMSAEEIADYTQFLCEQAKVLSYRIEYRQRECDVWYEAEIDATIGKRFVSIVFSWRALTSEYDNIEDIEYDLMELEKEAKVILKALKKKR